MDRFTGGAVHAVSPRTASPGPRPSNFPVPLPFHDATNWTCSPPATLRDDDKAGMLETIIDRDGGLSHVDPPNKPLRTSSPAPSPRRAPRPAPSPCVARVPPPCAPRPASSRAASPASCAPSPRVLAKSPPPSMASVTSHARSTLWHADGKGGGAHEERSGVQAACGESPQDEHRKHGAGGGAAAATVVGLAQRQGGGDAAGASPGSASSASISLQGMLAHTPQGQQQAHGSARQQAPRSAAQRHAKHSWKDLATGTLACHAPRAGGRDIGLATAMSDDPRACMHCGLNDTISPGACAFHPALVPDPGPLLFGPAWHACGVAGHRPADPPCLQRDSHMYAGEHSNVAQAQERGVDAMAAEDGHGAAAGDPAEEEGEEAASSSSPAPQPRTWLPAPLA